MFRPTTDLKHFQVTGRDNTVFASIINTEFVLNTSEMIFTMLKLLTTIERRIEMNIIIETPTVGEILFEEFMNPLGISAYRLAKEIGVPTSRIQDILHGRRKITAETSLRLAKFFGVSEKYFLNIQNDIDIRNLKTQISESLNAIHSVATA